MQYQTVYLVVVLICTKGVGMAGRMKVEPSCCVLGAGRTNNAPGAGLKWNAEVGEVAANIVEIRINRNRISTSETLEATCRGCCTL